MSVTKCSTESKRALAAGTGLKAAATLTVALSGEIQAQWLESGTATDDLVAAKQAVVVYNSVTGVQTIDLSAVSNGDGGTISFTTIKEIIIINKGTLATHVITAGAAAANPFIGGIFVASTTNPVIQAKAPCIAVHKPMGAGITVGSAVNLKLDFGALTFSAEVHIKGN